jgi:putative two-component system response regulator
MTLPPYQLLLVEDDPMDVRLFGLMLQELTVPDGAVRRANSLDAALRALQVDRVDVVFLDLDLPDSTGIETVERVLAAGSQVPVVVLTGNDDEDLGLQAVALGAQDYLVKDSVHAGVLARVLRYAVGRHRVLSRRQRESAATAAADERQRAVAEARAWAAQEIAKYQVDVDALRRQLITATAETQEAYDTAIEGWARALDLRDHETMGHSRRVADLALALARELGLPQEEIDALRRGALLHDIGKIAVPDAILLKQGPLTPRERARMERHTAFARELLEPIAFLRGAVDVPFAHHERWDGSGYPRGLAGEEIPLAARIFAVADVFDALTSDRPYRRAWNTAEAKGYVEAASGRLFDPHVVAAFLSLEIPRRPEPD